MIKRADLVRQGPEKQEQQGRPLQKIQKKYVRAADKIPQGRWRLKTGIVFREEKGVSEWLKNAFVRCRNQSRAAKLKPVYVLTS